MKCFFVVCIKVYPIFFRRDFFIEEEPIERRKRSHLQKEKKDNKNNKRETRERKKKTKERFREILRRETHF